jgi:hypothetical protein
MIALGEPTHGVGSDFYLKNNLTKNYDKTVACTKN